MPQLRNPLGSVGLWLLHGKEAEVRWGGVGYGTKIHTRSVPGTEKLPVNLCSKHLRELCPRSVVLLPPCVSIQNCMNLAHPVPLWECPPPPMTSGVHPPEKMLLRGCWCGRQPLRSQIFLPISIYFCVLLSPLMCDLLSTNGMQQKIMSFWNLVMKSMAFILFAPSSISFSLIPSSTLSLSLPTLSLWVSLSPLFSLPFSLCLSFCASLFLPFPHPLERPRCPGTVVFGQLKVKLETEPLVPIKTWDDHSPWGHPDVNLMGDL